MQGWYILKFTRPRVPYTDILLVTLQDFPYDRHYSAIGALINYRNYLKFVLSAQ